jgi:uncharacterized membrane protein
MKMTIRSVAIGGMVAAVYAGLTIWLHPLSYGPIQIRVSEGLTVLPFVEPSAVAGLFIGCFLANIASPAGLWDLLAGSGCTLVAALLTWRLRRTGKLWLAPLPPVVVNAFGVSAYLQFLLQPPRIPLLSAIPTYYLFVITIGAGELVACYGIGYPLLRILWRHYHGSGG